MGLPPGGSIRLASTHPEGTHADAHREVSVPDTATLGECSAEAGTGITESDLNEIFVRLVPRK